MHHQLDRKTAAEIADNYAQSVIEAAGFTTDLGKWEDTLKKLSLLVQHREMGAILRDPDIKKQEIADFMLDLMKKAQATKEETALVLRLVGNDHLTLAPQIHQSFIAQREKAEGRYDVHLTTGRIPTQEQIDNITGYLKRSFNVRAKSVEVSVQPSIGKGMILRFGDRKIDQTAEGYRARLKRIS